MPTDASMAIAISVTVVAVIVGVCALVGLRSRTPSAAKAGPLALPITTAQPAGDGISRELSDCLHLADCIARDADVLSAMATRPTPPPPRELNAALTQLVKTTRGLEGRLRRVGKGETPTATTESTAKHPCADTEPYTPPPTRAQRPSADQTPATAAVLCDPPAVGDFDDRKFPRSACPGSFKATIYPPPSKPGGEPVQCTVLTRDISCGGIGIAHTEELYPKQIIVLHAVTKLLIGEVRWCRRLNERSYIAGCQLIKASG